jgi:hypothetical protein
VFSVTVFTALLGSGFQQWTCPFLWPQLPASATLNWLSACRLSLLTDWLMAPGPRYSLGTDPTENTSPNSYSGVTSCSYQHGPRRDHCFPQLLHCYVLHSRYLAMVVSLAPQCWLSADTPQHSEWHAKWKPHLGASKWYKKEFSTLLRTRVVF